MEDEVAPKAENVPRVRTSILFFVIIAAIIAGAVIRSNITTSLDGFTFDEAYHIGAGVAYAKTGDFRLNPEHPPLTKLWVGTYLSFFDYQMTPYRPLADKVDERSFVEEDVYNNNDPYLIQSRARTAMFALNSLLLAIFALAVWRVLGPVMAVGATAFLAIDPTVAGHLPVVMTDLPVALLSGTAVLLAVNAFRSWRVIDLALASAALGSALAAKHSAVITLIAVTAIGVAMATLYWRNSPGVSQLLRRGALVAAMLIGSVVVLRAFYGFQYYENPLTAEDQFNRPLTEKISDVQSPVYRFGLNAMANGYLFPRSYIWGLADTIRAGAEGRAGVALVFGQLYYRYAPWFYAPGVFAVKLPIGLLLLSVAGAVLLIFRREPRKFMAPVAGLLLMSAIFIFFVIRGSSYGGVRHMLPAYPLFALLAAVTVCYAYRARSYFIRSAVAIGLVAAIASAVPVMRPWEYYNEIIGGTSNGHRYFNDEGIDLSQRSKEAVRYYHDELVPLGENPYTFYPMQSLKDPTRSIDHISSSKERDKGKWDGPYATGTFIVGANEIAPTLWWDKASFREVEPHRRFGNLFVFRGTFDIRPMLAQSLAYRASFQIYGPEPNIPRAIEMLSESVEIDPRAFFVALELGNQYLKLGNRDEALRAYRIAHENVPASDETSGLLARQIERVETEPLEQVGPLRNPGME